jgi:hypothetical protein
VKWVYPTFPDEGKDGRRDQHIIQTFGTPAAGVRFACNAVSASMGVDQTAFSDKISNAVLSIA